MMTIDHSLFGIFHILAAMVSVSMAVAAAVLAARFVTNSAASADHSRECAENACIRLIHVLTWTGLMLALLEVFKQFYLHFTSGSGAYDWWYFPFQLCSVPMYLCLLLPVTGPGRTGLRSSFLTFLGGYTFTGAAAALIYPEDILSAAPVMMAHGFIWHAVLLFISLLIFITGTADSSAAGLARAALLFTVFSAAAVIINVMTEPAMQTANTAHSFAAMFYLNPYHLSPQPIVSDIQKTAGIPAGLLLYSITTAFVSSLVSVAADRIHALIKGSSGSI